MSLVDMAKSPEEMSKEYGGLTVAMQSVYPYGLCMCLGQDELDKLGIDFSVLEVGDIIDMRCFAKITSKSQNATTSGESSRVELQITHMDAEDESREDEEYNEDEKAEPYKVKNPYKK